MTFINQVLIMGLLLSLNLSATTYEDGEDKKISRWQPLNPSEEVIISNVYDEERESHVLQFKGDGTRSAYMLMRDKAKASTWDNQKEKVLHWQMKYSEDFVIFVSLETKRGKRYLIYTPGSENGHMQYGLGDNATQGVWQQYSRDLEKDLHYFDNQNSIISVNGFVIRGSGEIDNIKLMNPQDKNESVVKVIKGSRKRILSKKRVLPKKRVISKISKKKIKSKKRTLKRRSDTTPEIIMEGENPIFLALGESFEEPGVRAEDREDGELVVTSSENIDKHKEGVYSVIYMATDKDGNAAIDKRYVHIGDVTESEDEDKEVDETAKEENGTETPSDGREEIDDEAQYRLEERELEIAEWEKELQLREKEIAQREQNAQKSPDAEENIP